MEKNQTAEAIMKRIGQHVDNLDSTRGPRTKIKILGDPSVASELVEITMVQAVPRRYEAKGPYFPGEQTGEGATEEDAKSDLIRKVAQYVLNSGNGNPIAVI